MKKWKLGDVARFVPFDPRWDDYCLRRGYRRWGYEVEVVGKRKGGKLVVLPTNVWRAKSFEVWPWQIKEIKPGGTTYGTWQGGPKSKNDMKCLLR